MRCRSCQPLPWNAKANEGAWNWDRRLVRVIEICAMEEQIDYEDHDENEDATTAHRKPTPAKTGQGEAGVAAIISA